MNDIHKILKDFWGHNAFRPLQEDIIESVLAGNDTLALLPTGGGKSICFQVPALAKEGLCLVISPLIALMKDQVESLNKKGIKASAVFSGMHKSEIDRILGNCLFGDVKFLYVSPERLKTDLFTTNLPRMKVSLIAIDEAHCISQWGYDFRPPYLEIAEIRQYFPNVPVIALTATATPKVVIDIQQKLKFKNPSVFQKSFSRSNLIYLVVKTENKLQRLLRIINRIKGSGVVYVRNRRKTQEIAKFLYENHITADFYHAGLDMAERDRKQHEWISGKKQVIVATNAFGMGIDKSNVRFVVHMDIPDSMEAYFQEAGRAGRDEQKAWAIQLYDDLDIAELDKNFLNSFPEIKVIRNVYNALCNYFQIPIGTGGERSFEFNLSEFAKEYSFNSLIAYNALKFLEKDGFLIITDAVFKPSKIRIACTVEDLYRFQVENKKFEKLIKTLLRSYGGLHSNFVKIDEKDLAKRMDIEVKQLSSSLIYLESLGILNYDKQTDKPILIFLEDRVDENQIIISPEHYQFLKETASIRLESIMHYVQTITKCRSKLLLEYFGEINSLRCGECDVCLQRNKMSVNDFEFDKVVEILKPVLRKERLTLEEVVKAVDLFTEEKTIKIINWLIDNKKVDLHDDKTLTWIKPKRDA